MKLLVATIVVSFCLFQFSQALMCLTCTNARSKMECIRRGRLVQCEPNQDACQMEVRTDGRGTLMTKRCKQRKACYNNFYQNPRDAWSPVQCNMDHPHTVCRCCCFSDNCNYDAKQCPSDCLPQEIPKHATRVCTYVERATEENARCVYSCNRGFTMRGPSTTGCVRFGARLQFTNPPPICVQSSCSSQKGQLHNGRAICSDFNLSGSVCRFECNRGFLLSGNPNITCLGNNKWNRARPVCRYRRCFPWSERSFPNGVRQCSNRNIVGSRCQFYCNAGYVLEGSRLSHCVDHGDMTRDGYWSTPEPRCVLAPIFTSDQFGSPTGPLSPTGLGSPTGSLSPTGLGSPTAPLSPTGVGSPMSVESPKTVESPKAPEPSVEVGGSGAGMIEAL